MEISLKCFATLAEADKCNYSGSTTKTLAEGARVLDMLKEMKISEREPGGLKRVRLMIFLIIAHAIFH